MEFFPSEPSEDSGLLEEIIRRFFPKTSTKRCNPAKAPNYNEESGSAAAVAAAAAAPQLSVNHMLHEGWKSLDQNDRLGYYFDRQGVPHQLENFNGSNGSQGVPVHTQLPMNYQAALDPMMDDIFQYPELLNVISARMQNA